MVKNLAMVAVYTAFTATSIHTISMVMWMSDMVGVRESVTTDFPSLCKVQHQYSNVAIEIDF